MTKLYVMMGIPGSGKTTYAKELAEKYNAIHVSRDEIRFSLISESDPYFSKEKEVFKLFIDNIVKNLKEGYDVIADATHLNETSRAKLFNAIWEYVDLTKVEIIGLVMLTPFEECLRRNEMRKGTRTYVPTSEIRSMNKAFRKPTLEEYNKIFDKIITVEERNGLFYI